MPCLNIEATSQLGFVHDALCTHARVMVVNSLSELDAPGEYYISPSQAAVSFVSSK